jgi:hypothetical protein
MAAPRFDRLSDPAVAPPTEASVPACSEGLTTTPAFAPVLETRRRSLRLPNGPNHATPHHASAGSVTLRVRLEIVRGDRGRGLIRSCDAPGPGDVLPTGP